MSRTFLAELPEIEAGGENIYRQTLAKVRENGELAADIERAMAHPMLLEKVRAKARGRYGTPAMIGTS